jgi:hypothetical protein
MLYGIQRAEQLRLAQEGYRSAVLISTAHSGIRGSCDVGRAPRNVLFLARNFFGS